MEKVSGFLTVLFQDPFWIGVLEIEIGKNYKVARVVFGPEPTEVQLYEFILNNYYTVGFGETIQENLSKDKKINYKRKQKIIKKQQSETGIGTKAQNAIKSQQELVKIEKKKKSKALRKEKEEELFKLKQQKKKEKHKGH